MMGINSSSKRNNYTDHTDDDDDDTEGNNKHPVTITHPVCDDTWTVTF